MVPRFLEENGDARITVLGRTGSKHHRGHFGVKHFSTPKFKTEWAPMFNMSSFYTLPICEYAGGYTVGDVNDVF